MKLIIQIPCYNESATLPLTLSQLPKAIEGVTSIEWLVIDDGSSDGTAEVAKQHGVHNVLRLTQNQGLACAFMAGLNFCIQHGADIIVNTDADNQYHAADIPALVKPIINGEADLCIGARPVSEIESFSPTKKLLQKFGSYVVRWLSGTNVQDATSGFRAISRKAATQLNVFSSYTYTLETIIQAGHKNLLIANVPVRVNEPTRKSRLIKSIPSYIRCSILTMVRVSIIYQPLRFFALLAALCFMPGFMICMRFLFYYWQGAGEGKIQSLILAALFIGTSALLSVVGVLADLIAVNRKLLERQQSILLEKKVNVEHGKNTG